MTRWPAKPRAGTKCDCSTGSGSDKFGAPVIYSCKNEAIETVLYKGFGFPVYLCESCLKTTEGQYERNPRRKA